ncbi:hypothetical protein FRC19_010765 [Serendipita sp. 401]|nr:hypothetical protein FRC19_010765 [Serendipita sp. 401]
MENNPTQPSQLEALASTSTAGDTTDQSLTPAPIYYERDRMEVEEELLPQVDSSRLCQLQILFASEPWMRQEAALDQTLIRSIVIRALEPPFKCPFLSCGKTFDTSNPASVHIEEHLGHKGHACNVCSMTFRRAADRNEHSRAHDNNWINCPKCGTPFKGSKNLGRHMQKSCLNEPDT